MLSEIVYGLFNMSIVGSGAGLIILGFRKVKRIRKSFMFVLWLIPFIRFTVPFGISYQYSLLTLLSDFATRTVEVYKPVNLPEITYMNCIQAADQYFPIVYKTNLLKDVFQAASVVWIIVFCALMLTICFLYGFTKAEIKDAVHIRDNIYQTEKITSPALYGILQQKIILPGTVDEKSLDYILMHENVHAHRRDNLWRCIALFVCCLHWFNPLVWLLLKAFFEDMELSCDEKVLSQLSADGQKEYAYVVLNAAAQKSLFITAFGGAKIKVRIENILAYRKITAVSIIAFLTFLAAVAMVLLTNAKR